MKDYERVEAVIARLKDLAEDRRSFFQTPPMDDDVFRVDYAALMAACEMLAQLVVVLKETEERRWATIRQHQVLRSQRLCCPCYRANASQARAQPDTGRGNASGRRGPERAK